ncbi:UDP-Glycosyltransferase superfamily protein [Actinidia rufa]|uniref:UDP-Glycosyltransferase superfamily protein n=1 Tax=Actinidia rufa TaxID=165716 RepID=A0A7J0G9U9_9ERIC|nr:UDP-Glycosyltransferase superfamily protein [Actinidia rufa]
MKSKQKEAKIGSRGRAAVVVLGDIGRSPRMQYHALSLARQASLEVDIVAYGGVVRVEVHQRVSRASLAMPLVLATNPQVLRDQNQRHGSVTRLGLRDQAPAMRVSEPLSGRAKAKQGELNVPLSRQGNPPSVPTLAAVKWASWLRCSAFIVDWHNFGFTLLALSLGRRSFFVALYHWFEKHYGKMANGSLCVTRAMQHELAQKLGN